MKYLGTIFSILFSASIMAQDLNPSIKVYVKNLIKKQTNLLDNYKFEVGVYDELKSKLKINSVVEKLYEIDKADSCVRMTMSYGRVQCLRITNRKSGVKMQIYFRFCQNNVYKQTEVENMFFFGGSFLYDMCNSNTRFTTDCLETSGAFESKYLSNSKSRDSIPKPPNTIYLLNLQKHKVSSRYLMKFLNHFECTEIEE